MKLRTIYILFAVLGLLLVLFAVAMYNGGTQPPDVSRYALPAAHDLAHPFAPSDVDRVEIKRVRPREETLVFVKDPKTSRWEIEQPRKMRAGPAVGTLVAEILNAVRDAEADVPANAQKAGLEPPAAVVTLKHEKKPDDKDNKDEERSIQLNVGEASSESSKAVIYVSSAERPKDIVPVRRTSLATVLDTLNDFRDASLLASATSDYARIKLSQTTADRAKPPKGPLELKKMDGGLWRYTDSMGYDGSATMGAAGAVLVPGKPPSGVDGLVKVLSDLRVEPVDWVEDGATDLSKYDLDAAKADVLTIEIDRILTAKDDSGPEKKEETKGTMTLLIGLGKKVGDKSDRYYAAVKDEEHGTSVVRIPTAAPDAVALEFADPGALRSKALVALGGFKKPLAVRVSNEAAKPPLEFLRLKAEDPWRLFRDGKEIPLDQAAVDGLINQLVQPELVRSFVEAPDEAKLGLNAQSPVVEIWVDGVEEEKKPENKDEKKDEKKDADKKDEPKPRLLLKSDKPAARLTYGAIDADLAAIKRYEDHGGWTETAVVKAPKLLEDQAKAAPLTYYDKALPKFVTGFDLPDKDLVEVELDRADGVYVISRDKPDSPWVFTKPQDWDKDHRKTKVNPAQVEQVLEKLLFLAARSLVVETPDDLDKYGLKTPALKVVVTKKVGDKNESYTYSFGKDAPDGGVYAQQSQRPMVFEVGKDILTTLNEDLRDRTVFTFDPSKVKGLKLTRLVPNSVTPDVVEFEKAGDQWKPKPDFPVDAEHVTDLVQGLAHLAAAGQGVTKDDKIKAAFDKDEEKTALTIDLIVEGEAQPLQLKVVNLGDKAVAGGVPPEKKGLYASSPNSPNLPGEIFQVPNKLFDGPMGGSIYFKKQ